MLLAVSLPYITSALEDSARFMTQFENHQTADHHEMSLTQKVFVLNMCTNYLPILLTAFIYVPFGDAVVPKLESVLSAVLNRLGQTFTHVEFRVDSGRLRNEVIALTVTGQMSSFLEENVLPLAKHKVSGWYRDYREAISGDITVRSMVPDDADESSFLARVRNEATLPEYNVQEDIAEIVLQFGYLALFSPVWPLIPMGFLINNWVELRSDFVKIWVDHQRPAPVRADGIGPWIHSLDALTWLGSISTAGIVHLFSDNGFDGFGGDGWATLPVTVFVSEHVLLLLRVLVRFVLQQAGSDRLRQDENQRYANRVQYLEEMEANKRAGLGLSVAERERRKSVLVTGSDAFWTKQVEDGASEAFGLGLINQVKRRESWKAEKME